MNASVLDQSIRELQEHKDAWARLQLARKVAYLQEAVDGCAAVAARQVAAANEAKGLGGASPLGGEEWAYPYLVIRLLRLLRSTLEGLTSGGDVRLPGGAVRTRANGQVVVRAFPLSTPDKLLFGGYRGEVWLQQGVTPENLCGSMASFYRQEKPEGKVALVLSAGNNAAIGPSDMIHKLFVEGQVCLFKHHPVNEYLAPFVEEAFGCLIRDGFLRTARGGADVGEYLCLHQGIDEIHLTGSDKTYDAIVFGPGEEGRKNKAADRPRLVKRVSAELGNVAPLIVVPGVWSDADLKFQAQNIATQLAHNCGFNCLSARVVVLHKDWAQGRQLMDEVRSVLAGVPQRRAYYPGAEERYDAVMAALPTASAIGNRSRGIIPYTLACDLDPSDRANPCFASECFMPLLAQTYLPGSDAGEFLHNAVEFANGVLWGSLNCAVIIPPAVERALGPGFEEAIANLRYGTVAVNQWSALSYVWATTWGAYPGHTAGDIQSGVGKVRDGFMFGNVEKSVVYGPLRGFPKPPWYITNKKTRKVFEKMVGLEAKPSLGRTMSIAVTAMGG